jgi:putative membrane protein
MHRTSWMRAALCAGLLLSGRGVLGQASPPSAAQPQRAASDQQFLQQALGLNQLELQLGQLATQRATTPEIKALGQKMVQKHTEQGRELSDLAKQSGLSGAAQMTPEQRNTFARMEAEPASSFDSAFKQTVDAIHLKERAMYQDEGGRAANPQLRAFAERRVAALQPRATGGQQPSKIEHGNEW